MSNYIYVTGRMPVPRKSSAIEYTEEYDDTVVLL
jgi:hypothetical protein